MANRVSMEQIARRVGLSKNTVSLAMREMPGISKNTRALIMRTALEMGYHYKQSGVEKRPSSRNLCIIVPTSAHDTEGFFAHVQLGIEQEAKKHHFNTIFHSYEENGKSFELPLCVRDGLASGMISVGRVSEITVSTIDRSGLPYVMADHYLDHRSEDCVLSDNTQGGTQAVEYLIAMGHRDIGFIGDIGATVSFRDRFTGFLHAMDRHGFPVNTGHCITDTCIDELIQISMDNATAQLEKLDGLPTAFFCANDAGAVALLRACAQMNLRIPEDLSVMGFDDTDISGKVTPGLSTMRVQKELMGRKAFDRLMAKIHDRHLVAERTLISTELVKRNSVARLQVESVQDSNR